MGIKFNADEVFAMAERMETNGAAFYRRAAQLQSKDKKTNADFLLKLAAMEDGHKATFVAMRKDLTERMREETAADPYMEASLYLSDMTDSKKVEGAPAITDSLTGKESLADILKTAIDLEGKAIVFYLGMKDMVSVRQGKDRLDAIIAEEKGHIVTLAGELRKLTKA